MNSGKHNVEIMTPINYGAFESWKDSSWKNRDEKYEKLKELLAQKVFIFIEKYIPDFKDNIDYYEVSTPLSIEHFTMHFKGQSYGIPLNNERYTHDWTGPKLQ